MVVAGQRYGGVTGGSKKEAEQRAAEAAWRELSKETDRGGACLSYPRSRPSGAAWRPGWWDDASPRWRCVIPERCDGIPDGADDFAAALAGQRIVAARRRGKFLWLPLESGDALLAHLGMSGQLLLRPTRRSPTNRTYGCGSASPTASPNCASSTSAPSARWRSPAAGHESPPEIAHIARDPLDEQFDEPAFVAALRRRRSGIKTALLDQGLISGVGNIYADEALWRTRLHGARRCDTLTRPVVHELLGHVRDVLTEALAAGGTSFDALYVNVNGESGWFERSLAVYGREGRPCHRCGAVRSAGNRSPTDPPSPARAASPALAVGEAALTRWRVSGRRPGSSKGGRWARRPARPRSCGANS